MNYRGDRSDFAKEIRAFSALIQQLEDTLFEIVWKRTLDQATGEQLDTLGNLIGGGRYPRLSRSDSAYRSVLYTVCSINHSRGEAFHLINALVALTGTTWNQIVEYPPATIVHYFASDGTFPELIGLMKKIKAGGVRYDIVQCDPDEDLIFSLTSSPATDAVHGLSDLSMTTGGIIANLLT